MPTVAEMELLNRSMSDLGHTLQNNRALTLQDRDRQDRRKLDEEMMRLKRDDMASDRSFKEREVTAREGQTRALAEYRDAMVQAKTDEDRFRIFHDMVKSGVVSKESLAAMSKAMSEKLGVQVELKMPEKEPKGEFETQATHNLKKVEEYLRRASEAEALGQTADAKRFREYATLLKSSVGKQDGFGPTAAEDDGAGKPPMSLEDALKQSKVGPIQSELDDHLQNISKGDMSFGLLNMKDRPARVRELEGQIFPLTNQPPDAVSGALNPPMSSQRQNIVPLDVKVDEVLPMPADKSALKVGAVYQTKRGPAQWDGKTFTKVK